ncbi:MAG: type I glyceraldehyde-3-phosphate dehydrogenase, partial [Candidatus Krumholzibacteriota bacterium]
NLDLVVELDKPLTAEQYNAIFAEAAEGRYKGLLGYTTEPIVSSDVIGNPHSGVIDSQATLSLNNGLIKSIVWYDNGWAYAYRLLETAKKMAGLLGAGEVKS